MFLFNNNLYKQINYKMFQKFLIDSTSKNSEENEDKSNQMITSLENLNSDKNSLKNIKHYQKYEVFQIQFNKNYFDPQFISQKHIPNRKSIFAPQSQQETQFFQDDKMKQDRSIKLYNKSKKFKKIYSDSNSISSSSDFSINSRIKQQLLQKNFTHQFKNIKQISSAQNIKVPLSKKKKENQKMFKRSHTLQNVDQQSKKTQSCSLCKKQYIPQDIVIKLINCQHIYHKDCYDKFILSLIIEDDDCIECKTSFRKIDQKQFNFLQINRQHQTDNNKQNKITLIGLINFNYLSPKVQQQLLKLFLNFQSFQRSLKSLELEKLLKCFFDNFLSYKLIKLFIRV